MSEARILVGPENFPVGMLLMIGLIADRADTEEGVEFQRRCRNELFKRKPKTGAETPGHAPRQ